MASFVPKETIQRLVKDIKSIIQNPLTEQGIYYAHDSTDMLKGYAMIVGPEDTPYFGGYYFFELTYPPNYPYSPPTVVYYTNAYNIRFNPNLYTCGKVCISLLNTWRGEQWTSCQTISTVLLTICTIFSKNPLLNEPGIPVTDLEIPMYNDIIEHANINIAVCDILSKAPHIYQPFFDLFYEQAKDLFRKNYETLLLFAQQKHSTDFSTPRAVKIETYDLVIFVDYAYLITKLQNVKEHIKI
jgi:ubiquitin-conjugating enzyme E2 Z